MVLNEHSLNQGDFQYDKYKDNGAIISQMDLISLASSEILSKTQTPSA